MQYIKVILLKKFYAAQEIKLLKSVIRKLVGFGRACAPMRCAHPSFWAHCHAKQGAARPPPPLPIAASLILIRPQKIY
jgi:hypothetical protein